MKRRQLQLALLSVGVDVRLRDKGIFHDRKKNLTFVFVNLEEKSL
jgi:hypothetical protein